LGGQDKDTAVKLSKEMIHGLECEYQALNDDGSTLIIVIVCVVAALCVTGGCLYYFCHHKKQNQEGKEVSELANSELASMEFYKDDLYHAFIDNETA
jgi:flagellar basal body-associated protein FliL